MSSALGVWVEEYRPKSFDELVGHDDIKSKLVELLEKGEIPNLLFYGRAGTGKTSAVSILLNSLDCESIVINASSDRGIDTMRDKVTNFASRKSFYKWKIVVLEEAENITGDAAKAFKMILEQYYKSTRFILTTNHIDTMYEPILSRLQKFEFRPQSIEAVVAKCKEILTKEQVKYEEKDLMSVIKASFPDLRSTIGNLQRYTVNKVLVLSKEHALQERYREVIVELLKTPNIESVNKLRALLSKLYNVDYLEMYRYLFDKVEIYALNKAYIIDILLNIEEHLFRSSTSLDKQLNFMSCLIKIMRSNSGGKL